MENTERTKNNASVIKRKRKRLENLETPLVRRQKRQREGEVHALGEDER